jgi:orotidine-5'-phosphate decarboxylase
MLVKTSNPGAGEFQDLKVGRSNKPLYQVVANQIATKWKGKNIGAVVGATYPKELKVVRQILGDIPLLIPGIGSQGGDVEKTIKAGKDSHGQGMIINSSRSIIYASNKKDFAHAARKATEKLHKQITKYLTQL